MRTNQFGIPDAVLRTLRERDKTCAYCRKEMLFPFTKANCGDSASIEHLNREGPFHWRDGLEVRDLVICCVSCNSSRGRKLFKDWFLSKYCMERGICAEKVATPVKEYLARNGTAAEVI